MDFKRHTINDVYNSKFFQMPKFLFEGIFKTGLSAEAKVLYALLRDRHELSLKNNWVNSRGEVYLIFTRDEMCDMLGYGKDKIRSLINELKSFSLLDEERQGLNRPNLIYLNYVDYINSSDFSLTNNHKCLDFSGRRKFSTPDSGNSALKTAEIQHSRQRKFSTQDSGNSALNNTNNNYTDFSDTNSINQSVLSENSVNIDNTYEHKIDGLNDDNKKIGKIDRNKLKFKVRGELLDFKHLPYHFANNYTLMSEAIHFMTEWDTFYPDGFKNEFDQSVYNLFNEALIDMCCSIDEPMLIKKRKVTYSDVIDKINSLAKFNDDYIDISVFMDTAISDYSEKASTGDIKHPLKYMQACIWSAMQTGDISMQSKLKQNGF